MFNCSVLKDLNLLSLSEKVLKNRKSFKTFYFSVKSQHLSKHLKPLSLYNQIIATNLADFCRIIILKLKLEKLK